MSEQPGCRKGYFNTRGIVEIRFIWTDIEYSIRNVQNCTIEIEN